MSDNAYSRFVRIEQLGPEIYERVYHVAEYEPKIQVYLGEYIFNRSLVRSTRLDHKYKNSNITVHRLKSGENTVLPSDFVSKYAFYVFKVKDEEIESYLNLTRPLEFREKNCDFSPDNRDKTKYSISAEPGFQYLAVIIGNKNCKFVVRSGEQRDNYRPCNRLCRAMNLSWPLVSVEKNHEWIKWYRKGRDNNTTDWEGSRERFKRILNYSIKNRHEVRSADSLADALITEKKKLSTASSGLKKVLDMFKKEQEN